MRFAIAALGLSTLFAVPPSASGDRQRGGQESSVGQQQTEQVDRRNQQYISARLHGLQPAPRIRGQRPVQMVLVTSIGRITRHPVRFYGVPVSVHAQIGDRTNRHLFTLEGDGWSQFGDDALVLLPNPQPDATIEENDYVTVVGTVRPFIRADIERDFEWFAALPGFDSDVEGRPMIVSDFARTSDGQILTAGEDRLVTRVLVAAPGDIAELPRRFFGAAVAIEAEVEDVLSDRLFTLDEDRWFAGPDVLVFNPFPIATPSLNLENEEVRVYGIVRPFAIADFEEDYDWFDAADYEVWELARYGERPAIVASSIVISSGELVTTRPDLALDAAAAELGLRRSKWAR
jgi:hypothetical protein